MRFLYEIFVVCIWMCESLSLPFLSDWVWSWAYSKLQYGKSFLQIVYRAAKIACKCHGVSGSCSLKTCWQQLPPFRDIGAKIKNKYDAAAKVMITLRGKLRATDDRYVTPTAEDMVYVAESPDYCMPNKKTGSSGKFVWWFIVLRA